MKAKACDKYILLKFFIFLFFSVLPEKDQLRLQIQEALLHPDYAEQAYQDVAVVKLKATESK